MKKKIIIGALAVFTVILAYSIFSSDESEVSVRTKKAMSEEIKSSILASGTLIYKDQIELRSEVIGQVSELFIEEGDSVTKDQILMQLDQKTFKADVEEMEAYVRMQQIAIERQNKQLENIQAQWERNKNLYERKMIGQDAYELVENQHELAKIDLRSREEALSQAKATLEKASERLSKTVFRSPITGIATSVDIKIGETAISGTQNIAGSNLMTIADPSSILVEVEVDEADIANVRLNQDVDVYAVAFPDDALKGRVKTIATSAKRASNREGLSFTVKILLEESNIDIRPGMTCRAEIFTKTREKTLAVPMQAVVFEEITDDDSPVSVSGGRGGPKFGKAMNLNTSSNIFVYSDGKAIKKEVKLGISNDELQEILSGIAEGDEIIIGPPRVLAKLKDGDSVKKFERKNKNAA